jgi:hypothetical protein
MPKLAVRLSPEDQTLEYQYENLNAQTRRFIVLRAQNDLIHLSMKLLNKRTYLRKYALVLAKHFWAKFVQGSSVTATATCVYSKLFSSLI